LNVELVDIGANLTHESFADDRAAVVARAVEAGVTRQVITGADVAGSIAAASLAAADPSRLWSTAGVHPHHAATFDASSREALLELLSLPKVVAVGECGLDYYRNFSPPEAQRNAFVAQLELAASIGKPVFLHQRDAHADFVDILRDFSGRLKGVAHCFTGGAGELDDYLAMGLHIGITGWVCDERRGTELRHVVPAIPSARLMIETDAPYLLPRNLEPRPRSRRNEPSNLIHVARTVAALRGESLERLGASTTHNAIEFFGLRSEPLARQSPTDS
jgi:TatD DNase family protein